MENDYEEIPERTCLACGVGGCDCDSDDLNDGFDDDQDVSQEQLAGEQFQDKLDMYRNEY